MNLYQLACKAFPHHDTASRMVTHRLRAKYIKALTHLGTRWILHPENQVKNKSLSGLS